MIGAFWRLSFKSFTLHPIGKVQVHQIENESLAEDEVDPLTLLNQLKEELHMLDNAQTELRDRGRMPIQQQDYKKTEDQVLLKLAVWLRRNKRSLTHRKLPDSGV